jgi:peptidoglycan/LPS O-acetylase OafA/YrhL
MKEISREASNKIQWIKFIGCILVVLCHSTTYKVFNISGLQEKIIDYFFCYPAAIGVRIFFVLSGFLMYKNVNIADNKITIYNQLKKKIASRVKSIFIPYIIFNVVWMIFTIVVQNIPFIRGKIDSMLLFEGGWRNVLEGIFLYKYNGVAWYLWVLIIVTVCSPIIYFMLHRKTCGFICLCLIFLACMLSYPSNIPFFVIMSTHSLFFYCFGAYVAMHHFDIINRDLSHLRYAGCIGLVCSVVMIGVISELGGVKIC